MAELLIDSKKIINNIKILNDHFQKKKVSWTLIVKVLSGNKEILTKIINSKEINRIHSLGDSRLSNLKIVKQINPEILTMYIKPPPRNIAKSIVKYADISFNTSYETIVALNDEAKRQNKVHKILIMIELGELREGIMRENVTHFYQKVFELDNIEIIGIGSNLGCMYGIEPTYDKLVQLTLYKHLIDAKFNQQLDLISGGSSITLPLLDKKKVPKSVNHFRVGEAAFLGTTPLTGKKYRKLHTDTFKFKSQILELEEKENLPDGQISDAGVGHVEELGKDIEIEKSYKAIVDFGVLDVDYKELNPEDKSVQLFGTTSDLTVYDLGKCMNNNCKYNVGDTLTFNPTYMGVARLMSSKFITKTII